MMTAREYLESFKLSHARINLMTEQVRKLEENMTSITAPMDKEQVSHTKNVSLMADTVALIVDMQKEIDQQTKELYQKEREAYSMIKQLHPDLAEILIKRYFDGLSNTQISRTIFITRRHVQRRMNDALAAFQVVYEKKMSHDVPSMSPVCPQYVPSMSSSGHGG